MTGRTWVEGSVTCVKIWVERELDCLYSWEDSSRGEASCLIDLPQLLLEIIRGCLLVVAHPAEPGHDGQ